MSEFGTWEDFDESDDYDARLESAISRAAINPDFDFYDEFYPRQPKFEIGQYVAEQGVSVPLIDNQKDWERAFDDGTAMLRSEMPQDYDGLSGLLSSERLQNGMFARPNQGYAGRFGSLVMEGLRSGELNGTEYMKYLRGDHFNWVNREADLTTRAAYFGVLHYLNLRNQSASRWRFVEGANVSVFADPVVEGRYHFGVKPARRHPREHQSIGSYLFEADEYDEPKQFRKHKVPFIARPFIEVYDRIRDLPRFDTTQNPVIELQQDAEGTIHFLQYLKTGQEQQYAEPFDLPESEDTVTTTNVRGVTAPEGKEMKLYIEPDFLTREMEGQGIYCGIIRPRGLEVQFASKAAAFILHYAYVSFQDNHFDASPMFRPPLAAGLSECGKSPDSVPDKLDDIFTHRYYRKNAAFDDDAVAYLDIKVTSNGRAAAIESDWQVKTVGYDDMK